jgi:hypothetical protein
MDTNEEISTDAAEAATVRARRLDRRTLVQGAATALAATGVGIGMHAERAAAAPRLDAVGVSFTNHGTHTLAGQASAWYGVANGAFSADGWQRVSAFPTVYNSVPAKITIVQEDWDIDEQKNRVCWVLIKNDVSTPVEFAITSLTTQ